MQRKVDHVSLALAQSVDLDQRAFSDFQLIHNCLPNVSIKEVNLEVDLLGLRWGAPLYINALTGGHSQAKELNAILGALAFRFGIPVAVGSQSVAVRDDVLVPTFASIRSRNPTGPVWANLSAGASLETMSRAVEMVGATALQLHLNAPQEAVQPEGDRDFRGWLENINCACSQLGVPVIAKEVGFGMAKEEVSKLIDAGVSAVDCSGRGGTDFLKIEQARHGSSDPPLAGMLWGIPTPLSILESLASAGDIPVLASGGVDTALHAIICLVLGSRAVGLGRALLSAIYSEGETGGINFLTRYLEDMKVVMALQGCRTPTELAARSLVVGGFSRDWILQRKLKMPHA